MVALRRSSRLTVDTSHDWERDGRYVECSNRGCTAREFSPDGEPDVGYACEGGLAKSEIERGSGPAPYSTTNSGREHQKDEAFRAYVRNLPCLVCGEPPQSDPHHVKTWGSGHGDFLEDGTGNLAPLCRAHHRELDSPGSGPETFAREHDVDLAAEAERIGDRYRQFRRAKA